MRQRCFESGEDAEGKLDDAVCDEVWDERGARNDLPLRRMIFPEINAIDRSDMATLQSQLLQTAYLGSKLCFLYATVLPHKRGDGRYNLLIDVICRVCYLVAIVDDWCTWL